MKPGLAILKNTVRQLLGRRAAIGLVLLCLIPAVVQLLVGLWRPDAEALVHYREQTFFLLFAVALPITTLILSTGALGAERRGKTLSFILLRPIARPIVAAAKLTATWLAAFALAAIGGAAAGAALGATTGDWAQVLPTVAGVGVGALGYASVFTVVGYFTDRATIVGLAYLLLWEGALAGSLTAISTTSLWRIGVSAYAGLVSEGRHWAAGIGLRNQSQTQLADLLGSVVPGFWGALAKVLVLAVIACVVLSYAFRRMPATAEA